MEKDSNYADKPDIVVIIILDDEKNGELTKASNWKANN